MKGPKGGYSSVKRGGAMKRPAMKMGGGKKMITTPAASMVKK